MESTDLLLFVFFIPLLSEPSGTHLILFQLFFFFFNMWMEQSKKAAEMDLGSGTCSDNFGTISSIVNCLCFPINAS